MEKKIPISILMESIPLNIKIRSILKQNDLKNWVEGKYIGDEKQLENTARALEWVMNEHFKISKVPHTT